MKDRFLIFTTIVIIVFFASCKKDTPDAVATTPLVNTNTPATATGDILKDSALLLTKNIYLWNEQIPSTFNARSYEDPVKEMEAIRAYSMEPGFSSSVDRFSFAMKQTEWDAMSAGVSSLLAATASEGDFGLTVFFRSEGDLRVRLVEPNSPAGLSGIHRGWRIIKVNQNENITTSNTSYLTDNIYNAAATSFTFQKPDGSVETITLNRTHYQEKPVYLDTVITSLGKRIGYLVFNSFLGNTADIYSSFERVFSKFASANISDIIVDLRYNGGGYVAVQERLANYLVSASANGSVMMKQVYNSGNTRLNETTLFKKQGSLNLNKIYFIVSKATASASELLINNLKPFMNVQMVGNNTYGKPVGFFPIPVGEWYIFPVSFRSTNANGEGNYFNGLTVNSRVSDGLDKDWGDVSESCLASVISNINSGNYRVETQKSLEESVSVINGNDVLDKSFLKVTIGNEKNLSQ